jgi:predicted permease
MVSDIRFALRSLRRNPGLTAVALFTLALGIGGITAIFSVFSGILLRPLPYADANRLVAIQEVVPSMARFGPALPVSAWHFREWRKQSRSLEGVALVAAQLFTLSGQGDPVRVPAARVSASLFPLLGIQAAVGRTFSEEEDQEGHDRVAVISYRLWRNQFHGDPAIVGRKIILSGVPREVIGVLPAAARVPTQGDLQNMAMNDSAADVWVPFAIGNNELAIMAEFNYGCVGRLRAGVSPEQAVADLNLIQAGIVKDLSEKVELRSLVTRLRDQITGSSRQSLTLLLAAAAAVLAIVVVNLANLLLARAAARRRELAIRTAIGAGTFRLVRQMLVEALLLACMGGILGVVLARWALDAIILKAPLDLPGLRDVRLDWEAVAFAAFVTLISGAICGILPAWRMARADPQAALKSGGRAITEGRHGGRLRRLLVSAEVALSAMCLVVGGLLLGSFVHLVQVDKGFLADRAFTVGVGLPPARYPDAANRTRFIRALLAQVHSLPGVIAAGVSNRGPLSGEGSNLGILVEGVDLPPSQRPIVDYRCVSREFFRAMGIPLVGGRLIDDSDGDRRVTVVSTQTARRLWPGENAIGRRFRLGAADQAPFEVVGIVGDVRSSLQKPPSMTVYVPYWQVSRSDFSLVVRTASDPASLAPVVRGAIRGLDSQLVIPRLRTLSEVVDSAVAARRFQLQMILVFALTALLLAAIGVYGVVSQSVTQRTNEIGIRMALGATRAQVGLLVSIQGLAPVLAGLAVGLTGAAWAARLVNGLLFQVRTLDPLAFGGSALVLFASAALACLVPTTRATRVDALIALRYE